MQITFFVVLCIPALAGIPNQPSYTLEAIFPIQPHRGRVLFDHLKHHFLFASFASFIDEFLHEPGTSLFAACSLRNAHCREPAYASSPTWCDQRNPTRMIICE